MTQWPSDSVVTNGIKLNYYRSGGDKPPLVLCHGLTDNGLCWTRVAQELEKDYDLIMVDARGHGLSEAPESGYGATTHAADVAGLIQALGLQEPRLIGHSMGAMTVAVLAANYPDLVGRAVLEDPPWRDDDQPDEARDSGIEEWRASIIKAKDLSAAEIVATGRETNPSWQAIEFDAWALAKQQAQPNVFNYIEDTKLPWPEVVSKIDCPTLLVTGDVEAGAIVSQETAQQSTALRPNIQAVHIKGAGHNIRREQFEQFMTVVREFLA